MKNIESWKNSLSKKDSKWNNLKYAVMLSTLLWTITPIYSQEKVPQNVSTKKIEVVATSMVDDLQKKLWIWLPNEYEQKVKIMLLNNKAIQYKEMFNITKEFIINQMEEDRGIDKQNQLLFIWDAIYVALTREDLYEWDDWNDDRFSEFEKIYDKTQDCQKLYAEKINNYINDLLQQTELDLSKSREDLSKSREDLREVLYKGHEELIRFYELYHKDPKSVSEEEIMKVKDIAKRNAESCKRLNIDYRSILWEDVCKFFGI